MLFPELFQAFNSNAHAWSRTEFIVEIQDEQISNIFDWKPSWSRTEAFENRGSTVWKSWKTNWDIKVHTYNSPSNSYKKYTVVWKYQIYTEFPIIY